MCDIRAQDKAEYRRLLAEIGEDYCPRGKEHYCIFKEFLVASHPSRRLLVQLKCCDRKKYELSEKAGKDIGWDETLKQWVAEGFATAFAEAYDDKKSVRDIYVHTVRIAKPVTNPYLTCVNGYAIMKSGVSHRTLGIAI